MFTKLLISFTNRCQETQFSSTTNKPTGSLFFCDCRLYSCSDKRTGHAIRAARQLLLRQTQTTLSQKEVVVNIVSGRAAMISAEYPGSVPDIEVLRGHSHEVNAMRGATRMLADKCYRGDAGFPNCVVVSSEIENRKD